MKNQIKTLIVFILLTLMAFTSSVKEDVDCGIMHEGTFTYYDNKDIVKVVIKGEEHIEYYNDGKYYIKSKITWLNECEFDISMKEITLPNFPFQIGDIMHVKITKVEVNIIYCTSKIKGHELYAVFTKIE